MDPCKLCPCRRSFTWISIESNRNIRANLDLCVISTYVFSLAVSCPGGCGGSYHCVRKSQTAFHGFPALGAVPAAQGRVRSECPTLLSHVELA